MVEMAEAARRFVQGRRRDDLETDDILAFALARALEILGEAASKVAPETRQAVPEIAWTQIIGMRNRLAHAYQEINFNIMWKTATQEVPGLLSALRTALAEHDPDR